VTINFPWGSLLQGLLEEDSPVMQNVLMTMRPNAKLTTHLNGGALQEQGYMLEAGSHKVQEALRSRSKYRHAKNQQSATHAIELNCYLCFRTTPYSGFIKNTL
jgi:hypothetical protein